MQSGFFFLIVLLITSGIHAQNLDGAWEATTISADGIHIRNVLIVTDGYQVITRYDAQSGKFFSTNGGSLSMVGMTVTEVVEFDSLDPERVGSKVTFDIYLGDSEMGIVGDDIIWTRIDDGTPGMLQGAWLMSGRYRNGELSKRDTDRPRKTMKILSGSRFQWIAYNTETKQFMGTGGGSYTTIDGQYIESIEFFSRDDTRVGASLKFDFDIIDAHWHHKGFSSKGDPLHEIWSARE